MKDKKLYKCPKCGHTMHSVGRFGKEQRCINPDCPVSVVKNPDPVKAGIPERSLHG